MAKYELCRTRQEAYRKTASDEAPGALCIWLSNFENSIFGTFFKDSNGAIRLRYGKKIAGGIKWQLRR